MVRARVGLPVGIAIAVACAFGPGQIAALTDGQSGPATAPPPAARGAAEEVRVRSPAAVLARRAELRAARTRERARRAASDAAPEAPAATVPVPAAREPAPTFPPPPPATREPARTTPGPPSTKREPDRSTPPRAAPTDEPIPFDDSG